MKKYVNHLLNFSQRFLRLDTRYFAKASFYSGIQQTIGIVAGLIISYVFGHFASKKLFGDYNLVLSVLGFLTILTLPGLDDYLIRSIGQKYDSSYLRAVKAKLLLSFMGSPVLFWFSFYFIYQSRMSLGLSFFITALLFPFLAPVQLFNEFFTAKLNFKAISFFLSFSSILSALFISVAVFSFHSLPLTIIAYIMGILIPSLIAFYYSLRFVTKTKRKDPTLISYGLFNTALTFLPWTAGYFGRIILGVTLGTELLAVFSVANRLPMYVQKNLSVFYKPATAKLALYSEKQHVEALKKHAVKLILLGILFALPIYFFSPFFIRLIFTEQYAEAIPLAQILSLGVIPLPITWIIGDIMVFQKIKKPRVYTSIFVNAAKITLYFVLVPLFKLNGLVGVFLVDRYLSPFLGLFIILLHSRRSSQ